MAITHGTRSDPAPDGVNQRRSGGGDAVVGDLIDASHRLHPDELPAVVARIIADLPASETVIYIVDYDQRVLVPLPTDAQPTLDIDASLAGRAFQREVVLADPTDGGTRLWVPLVDGADRLGVLAVVVPEDGDLVRTHLRRFAGVVAHLLVSKSSYGDSLQLARRRQAMDLASELLWSMLPPLTFSHAQVGIAGILEPAHCVAGDCFDYALNGELAHIAILDAMGHGLEASRIATLALAAYRNSRRRRWLLGEIFATIDEAVVSQFGDERFVTGQLGELDIESGRLSWLNAGHPRPLLLRGGTHVVEVGGTPSLPFGLGDVPSELAEVDLEPGDQVLFFTDGVIEARSHDGEFFGRHRLGDLLVKSGADALPIAETVRRLCHAALAWGGPEVRDDATLVLVEWRGPRVPRHLS